MIADTKGGLLYSVIMPAHRLDQYLLDAIESTESAIGQDNAELIIVVNGKHRNEIACAIKNKVQLKNTIVELVEISSLSYNLNRGIEISRGKYIARFDSDDICLSNRFTHQLKVAKDTGADFVFSSAEVINANSERLNFLKLSTTSVTFKCGPIHPAAFIKREVLVRLGGYGHIETSEDYMLWLNANASGCKFFADPTPVIKYRIHDSQTTSLNRIYKTLLTNIGIKVLTSLSKRKPVYILGIAYDIIYIVNTTIRIKLSLLKAQLKSARNGKGSDLP